MEVISRRRQQRRHGSNEAAIRTVEERPVPKAAEPSPPKLPSWGELPAHRRRRLVAVLGDLVLRAREEERRDEASKQGEVDECGAAQ